NSRAFLETPVHQVPHVKFEWLQGDAEDLIALTGGPDGPISLAINADHAGLAAARCERLASLFGDRLYIELQRHGIEKERRAEAVLFADVPEALASTIEIAERCSFRPVTRKPILPRFTVGAGANTADAASDEAAELRRQAEQGLSYRLKLHGLARGACEEDYRAR